MNNFLLGWAISSTLITVFVIFLLYKKDTSTTNNDIARLKQKNKGNKGSNIDNDITPTFEAKAPKNGLLNRIKSRRKNKLKN